MNTQIDIQTPSLQHSDWNTPSQQVGSGYDARSSENGLLTIMYGSLEHASRFEWLNAGRTLVDKTYINILWQAADLPPTGVDRTRMASDLDAFVRAHLQPLWQEFEHLTHDEKHQLTIKLVERAANDVFGTGYQEEASSWLLYYLCPPLPVFPMNDVLRNVIADTQGKSVLNSYAEYHQACRQQFSHLLPHIHSTAPAAEYGTVREIDAINQILRGSDWWQRRCLIHHLLTA
ncbi:hypothetical protein IOQ59_13235 [Pontibacterium sp. N1Y112]|uniref:Uncharacterized protein n=1 Tax=Pontibacterium sinense TaxID=2781979 RepID=A0A8J7JZW5_9GAMM|nr:hypothetical protein [Pontibacterium sinense]MBE9398219.1 hypothetical protein [Pontibacterium sinense]